MLRLDISPPNYNRGVFMLCGYYHCYWGVAQTTF